MHQYEWHLGAEFIRYLEAGSHEARLSHLPFLYNLKQTSPFAVRPTQAALDMLSFGSTTPFKIKDCHGDHFDLPETNGHTWQHPQTRMSVS